MKLTITKPEIHEAEWKKTPSMKVAQWTLSIGDYFAEIRWQETDDDEDGITAILIGNLYHNRADVVGIKWNTSAMRLGVDSMQSTLESYIIAHNELP